MSILFPLYPNVCQDQAKLFALSIFLIKAPMIIIINAIVFSKLFYCSSVWSNTTQANRDKPQGVQNFACRILCSAKKFRSDNPFAKRLGLATSQATTLFLFCCSGFLVHDVMCSRVFDI